MPESAEELYARVTAAAADGRLPAPAMSGWDIFPWEVVDGAVVPKRLDPPAAEEARLGDEGGGSCPGCAGFPTDRIVWEDEHWVLTAAHEGPSGLPVVVMLWTREHLDSGDLDDELASQFGRLSNRIVRIIHGLGHVGRVHVNRWGDGCAHFHVWFFARPQGFSQLRGSYAVEWDDILPPVPEDIWHADLQALGAKLANWGGTARA